MATPPTGAGGAHRSRIFGRTRLIFVVALMAVLVVCLVWSWLTRGAMANLSFLRARGGAGTSLVDQSPWQTAQTLASLAVTAEENEYAREAEHLADHEVDQAFAAALREAELQTRRRVLTGEALTLSQRVTGLQQEIAQDRLLVDQLQAKSQGAAGDDALQVAKAQLGLDSDELTDAESDLDRATGNRSVQIQSELAAREAAMKKYDSAQQGQGQSAAVSVKSHGTLAGRVTAWFDQRSRYASIEQAQGAAESDARTLTAEHNDLEAKMKAAAGTRSGSATVVDLQNRSTERQILSIDDDRIETEQQLAAVYGKWGAQVQLQHRIVLHLILQSLALIVLLVLLMIVGDAVVRRLMERPKLDRKQSETLRTILEVGVQVLGALLIVLVIFGPPHQTGTMIGLATAALTIALQDYILAFLGWFMLVGKNGIRVGDVVEINGVSGEVIEVGLVSTTLLETTGLAEQGEPTGRRVSFLNSFAIRGQYFNFSSEGQWLWDEIMVSVPAEEDIYSFAKSVEAAAREETAESARMAEEEWRHSARVGGLTRLGATPVVMLRPSGAGIELQVRYVTRASGRFEVRDRLYRKVIELLHEKGQRAQGETGAA
ncbi:MAG: mechanosensitive ion channel domain-containing protein [Acidobacteriaceae bacterium]